MNGTNWTDDKATEKGIENQNNDDTFLEQNHWPILLPTVRPWRFIWHFHTKGHFSFRCICPTKDFPLFRVGFVSNASPPPLLISALSLFLFRFSVPPFVRPFIHFIHRTCCVEQRRLFVTESDQLEVGQTFRVWVGDGDGLPTAPMDAHLHFGKVRHKI